MRRLIAPLCAALALIAAPAAQAYDPADQPPFGGEPVPEAVAPPRADVPPPGYALSARQVEAIADRTEVVQAERLQDESIEARALTRGAGRWEVKYFASDGGGLTEVAQVHVSDPGGQVLEAWSDHQVETKLARGYDGAVGGAINSPWIWLALCVLFVAPFLDPRRPGRLVHLDLLVIVALSVSLLFFNRGEITASVPLTYPVLGYLFVRLLIAGFRPREREGPLVPYLPIAALGVLAVVLFAGRVALNIADSSVIDIGVAGVVGADRILDGASLYEGVFAPGIDLRGDVYGPLNYLLYTPFEAIFPWQGVWDDVPAAHAASIAFDALAAFGLLVLGRRMRPGEQGRALGVALAFAWLVCPWTAYGLNANTNDALVAVAIVGAMLALAPRARPLASPTLSGVAIALGTAAKIGPVVLAPLFSAGTGERRLRSIALFTFAFVLVSVIVFGLFLPDGGPREVYDRTFGYQASRGSPFSVWGLAPSLDWLQVVARAFAVGLAVALAFVPRRRSLVQIAALAGALLIATQVAGTHWFYFYVLWFLPLVLVAAFGEQSSISPRSQSPAGRASAS